MDELQAQNQDAITGGRILLSKGQRRNTPGIRHPAGKAHAAGKGEQEQSQAKRNMLPVLGYGKKGVPAIQDMEHH